MKLTLLMITGCLLVMAISCSDHKNGTEPYNIVWDSPGGDPYGSMPVGNGDIGLNVWVEENGDICFYIGKTDSWGDNGRLLKVGKVRLSCEPAFVFQGSTFTQELDLRKGSISINADGRLDGKHIHLRLNLWVDANHPSIHITHESPVAMKMTAAIELWRTSPQPLPWIGVSDLMEDRSLPHHMHEQVIVEPDHLISDASDFTGWYHHNHKSAGFGLTNQLQGLSEFLTHDPILHRTFGALITGTSARRIDETKIETSLSEIGGINIYVLTTHPSTPEEWLEQADMLRRSIEKIPLAERRRAHEQWWADFWNRSWINASSKQSDDAFIISRGYALQRFMDAAAGRGKYPVKFNGSIFTVPAGGMPGDADYRRWGPGYWWQNTRLPYLSMCAAGDYDLLQPLFNMYSGDIYELSKKRTRKYFGFDGIYFPECVYFWGANFTGDYGWTPYEERPDKLQESGWHKWEWVSAPELVFMMLDYYDHCGDIEFLHDKIIPMATDIMRFFDNYYDTGEDGKLHMHPSMSAETWWDCNDPMPEVAALQAITMRLLALPLPLVKDKERSYWEEFLQKIPGLPLRETPSGKALAPAARYDMKNNVENPELYAVFPFRHIGIGRPNIEWGINALEHRWDSGNSGWRQDDIFMAYLGLTDQAREYLAERAMAHDTNFRFPAFWGPNYDWTPDQDHGGVLMKTFQSMLMQADPYSRKVYLFPAWPSDWDVEFRLHAPYQTIIEGSFKDGRIEKLNVSPPARRDEIIIMTYGQ